MKALLKKVGIKPNNIDLYEQAMTHSSYGHENQTTDNERLEFLGDAVIEVLTSDYLFHNLNASEGQMTKMRAQAVCEEALVTYANHLNLSEYIKLGKGEVNKGANDAILADAFEALFGAIYADQGIEEARRVFNERIEPYLGLVFEIKDYKSLLQEYIQSGDKRNISYHIIHESGPSHAKEFHAVVKLDKEIILGTGIGKTKKEAEQNAAQDALGKGNYDLKTTD
ncbi:MAG: ribonuclease III [Acholeplasmataceae bacterium]